MLSAIMLGAVDWVALATIATAVATLVLAIATFASVRAAGRSARAAEESLAAQLWPLLTPSRPDDPEQKVLFQDDHKVVVPGGQGALDATADAVYFAIPLRNVGPGLAVLDAWHFRSGRQVGTVDHADVSEFRRLTRDLYIPAGDTGFWQGAIRNVADPQFAEATALARDHGDVTIELLYSDHLGNQRTITRIALLALGGERWLASGSRHFTLDRPAPR
jgi:hypothetical protein